MREIPIFEAPADPDKYSYPDGSPEPEEPVGDRIGQFTPEIGAHADAADSLPSHEDLLARQARPELTESEKAQGREAAEHAKKLLGL